MIRSRLQLKEVVVSPPGTSRMMTQVMKGISILVARCGSKVQAAAKFTGDRGKAKNSGAKEADQSSPTVHYLVAVALHPFIHTSRSPRTIHTLRGG